MLSRRSFCKTLFHLFIPCCSPQLEWDVCKEIAQINFVGFCLCFEFVTQTAFITVAKRRENYLVLYTKFCLLQYEKNPHGSLFFHRGLESTPASTFHRILRYLITHLTYLFELKFIINGKIRFMAFKIYLDNQAKVL